MRKNDGFKHFIIILTMVLTIVGIIPTGNKPVLVNPEVVYASNSAMATGVIEQEVVTQEVTTQEVATQEVEEETETNEIVEEPVLPEYTVEAMSAVLFAQTDCNIRKGPSTDYEVIGGLVTNQPIDVTGRASTGWYQVIFNGQIGYVSGSLLKETQVVIPSAPEPEPEPVPEPVPTVEPVPVPEPEPVVEPVVVRERWEYTEEELIQLCLSECITPGMSDWDKAIAIHDYLCDLMTYDYTYSHCSTFDALAYGIGVCQGYANAYKKLMDAAGIPTDYVSGYSSGGRHAWNRVLIDGQYYYVDVTWDDSSNTDRYLLISYEEMSIEHHQMEINRQNRIM